MFRVNHLTLHNICQYEDISIDISIGLTAVCGRNGRGKTTLLRALMYGLTGLVDGGWGNQQTLQKDGSTDPGYVEVSFTDNVNSYTIRRFSVSSPKFPDRITDSAGNGTAVRRASVDAFMTTVFGISPQLFFQLCWGRQGQLDFLLTAPTAAVNTFLAAVFDTKKLEKLREKLKLAIDSIANYPGTAGKSLQEARESLKALTPAVDLSNELTAAKTQQKALSEELHELSQTLSTGMDESLLSYHKRNLDDEIRRYEADMDAFVDLGEEPEAPMLHSYDYRQHMEMLKEQRESLNVSYTYHEASYRTAVADGNNLEIELQKLKSDKEETLVKLAVPQDCVCELCKSKVTDLEAYEAHQCQLLTGFANRQEYIEDADSKQRELEGLIDKNAESQSQLNSKLQQIGNDVHNICNELEDVQQLLNKAVEYETWHAEAAKKAYCKKQLADARAERTRLDSVVPVSTDLTKKKKAKEAELAEVTARVQFIVEQIADNNAQRRYLEHTIADMEAVVKQAEINTEARKALISIRDILSQQRAQSRYLNTKIAEINARISGYMQETDMPFSLYLNEQSHLFEYTTTGGFVHPATHLSGAQKNIASVILQMTLMSVICPNMNLFLVDEPSESLDIENKFVMATLFQKLNNLLPSMDGVMLIVTRDEQLIESCENVIQIGDDTK